jgi:hypothetical protein
LGSKTNSFSLSADDGTNCGLNAESPNAKCSGEAPSYYRFEDIELYADNTKTAKFFSSTYGRNPAVYNTRRSDGNWAYGFSMWGNNGDVILQLKHADHRKGSHARAGLPHYGTCDGMFVVFCPSGNLSSNVVVLLFIFFCSFLLFRPRRVQCNGLV